MTVAQLMNALAAIPEEYRGAEVWQQIEAGRIQPTELRLHKRGLVRGEPPVLLLTWLPYDATWNTPPDLTLVPGIAAS